MTSADEPGPGSGSTGDLGRIGLFAGWATFWIPCVGLVVNAVLSPLGASRARQRGEPQSRYWYPLVASVVTSAVVPLVLVAAGAFAWVGTASQETPTASGRADDVSAAVAPDPTAAPTGLPAGYCQYAPAPADGQLPHNRDIGTPPASAATDEPTARATMSMSAGVVTVELDLASAPCTTRSFAHLAAQKYFDGTTCHRLTTAGIYVLQCGDPTGTGRGGPGYQFANENLPIGKDPAYPAGTLAMANAGPDTNGSQFFIVYDDTQLSPDYTVFGRVTAGLDVLERIASRGVQGGATDGPPREPVKLTSVSVG